MFDTPYLRRLDAIAAAMKGGATIEQIAGKLGRKHEDVSSDMCGQPGIRFFFADKLQLWFPSSEERDAAEFAAR